MAGRKRRVGAVGAQRPMEVVEGRRELERAVLARALGRRAEVVWEARRRGRGLEERDAGKELRAEE